MKGRGAKRHVGGVVHHKGASHHKGDVHIHGGVHNHGKHRRKFGGKIEGAKPEMRLDKRARGGRMTPKSPLSGASVKEKSFARSTVPSINEGGEGAEPEGRSRGGRTGIHIKHPGKLHRDLGIPQGEKIPEKKLAAALHSKSPALRKEANFARNERKWHH
jgi:hypothetical protein